MKGHSIPSHCWSMPDKPQRKKWHLSKAIHSYTPSKAAHPARKIWDYRFSCLKILAIKVMVHCPVSDPGLATRCKGENKKKFNSHAFNMGIICFLMLLACWEAVARNDKPFFKKAISSNIGQKRPEKWKLWVIWCKILFDCRDLCCRYWRPITKSGKSTVTRYQYCRLQRFLDKNQHCHFRNITLSRGIV